MWGRRNVCCLTRDEMQTTDIYIYIYDDLFNLLFEFLRLCRRRQRCLTINLRKPSTETSASMRLLKYKFTLISFEIVSTWNSMHSCFQSVTLHLQRLSHLSSQIQRLIQIWFNRNIGLSTVAVIIPECKTVSLRVRVHWQSIESTEFNDARNSCDRCLCIFSASLKQKKKTTSFLLLLIN